MLPVIFMPTCLIESSNKDTEKSKMWDCLQKISQAPLINSMLFKKNENLLEIKGIRET